MGNLADDTAVELVGEGAYHADVSEDWQLWGVVGGYMASLALRAVGEATELTRPATLSCQYLAAAQFSPVEIRVTPLRQGRRSAALRATAFQQGQAVLDAAVWAVSDGVGPTKMWARPPATAGPYSDRSLAEAAAARDEPHHRLWDSLEIRPTTDDGSAEPRMACWQRFRPQATFDDPWVDACRAVMLVDIGPFPAVMNGLQPEERTFIAPSMDLYVGFGAAAPASEWLLSEALGVVADGGVVGGQARVWSEEGALVAFGAQQMRCRPFG